MTDGVQSEVAAKENGLPLELRILELFHAGNLVVLGPTDVQKHTGVSKGTVSAKLKVLAQAGYLKPVGAGKYQPGGKLFSLAVGYLGLVMRQLDQVQRITIENLAGVREALEQLAGAFPTGDQT